MTAKKKKEYYSDVNIYSISYGLILPIVYGFILPIVYVSRMPESIMFFLGVLFFILADCDNDGGKGKEMLLKGIIDLVGLIGFTFSILEVFKNPMFSDGFTIYALFLIISIILVLIAIIISIFKVYIKNKYLKFIPITFFVIATLLYIIVIEFLY